MKLGRKGFMLSEVVVVSVIIAAVLVILFTGINNVSSAYETRNRYYDVDSLYAAMEINDILISENSIDTLINNDNVTLLYGNGYGVDSFMNFYSNNVKYYITSSYFVPYNSDELSSLRNYNINVTFKEYIDYLGGNFDFDDDYDYVIIVERENPIDENDCYYYALKLKY